VVGLEALGESQAGQRSTETGAIPYQLHSHGIVLQSEVHLVAWDDPQGITHRLRDHHLAF